MDYFKIMTTSFPQFTSVQILERIENIKEQALNQLSNGNFTMDYEVIEEELKLEYQLYENIYRKLLFHDKSDANKYYESLESAINELGNQYNAEQITLKQTNYDRFNKLTASNYYLYKLLLWKDNERFKEVEVIRNTKNGYILKKEIIDKSAEMTKGNSLYIGPMDIAYYKYYSGRYFLKNSFILQGLLKLEKQVFQRILLESQCLLNLGISSPKASTNANIDSNSANLEELVKLQLRQDKRNMALYSTDYNSILDQIEKGQELWGKRHKLFFDYFVAVQHIENIDAIESAMYSMVSKKQNQLDKGQLRMNFLHNELHKAYTLPHVITYFKDKRNRFSAEYKDINREIKEVSKILKALK